MTPAKRSPPATKRDVTVAAQHLRIELRADMATMGNELRGEMATMRKELRDEIGQFKTEIVQGLQRSTDKAREDFGREVQMYNEQLFHDFKGAFSDRTELLKDKTDNHEHR